MDRLTLPSGSSSLLVGAFSLGWILYSGDLRFVSAARLHRLLRALASLGLLKETPEDGFSLTKRGTLLRTDVAGSLRYLAMLEGGLEHTAIWERVPSAIKDALLSPPRADASAGRSDLGLKKLPEVSERGQSVL